MYEVSSQTVTEDYKAETSPISEWKFQLDNGNTGVKIISEPLLDTEALAQERAKSEFLKNGHKIKEITFTTHLQTIQKNDTINVYGLPYLVKDITTTIDEVEMKSRIRAVRYE